MKRFALIAALALPIAAHAETKMVYFPTPQDRHELSACVIKGGVGTPYKDCILPVVTRIMDEMSDDISSAMRHGGWPAQSSQVIMFMRSYAANCGAVDNPTAAISPRVAACLQPSVKKISEAVVVGLLNYIKS